MLTKDDTLDSSNNRPIMRYVPPCVGPSHFNRLAPFLFIAVAFLIEWCLKPLMQGLPRAAHWGFLLAIGAGALWLRWIFHDRHLRKICHQSLTTNLATCLECGYSLEGLPESHRCPECGSSYHLPDTKQKWRLWFATRHTGRFDPLVVRALEVHLEAVSRMKSRHTCIRCGHPFASDTSRICSECGAKHEVEPPAILLDN